MTHYESYFTNRGNMYFYFIGFYLYVNFVDIVFFQIISKKRRTLSVFRMVSGILSTFVARKTFIAHSPYLLIVPCILHLFHYNKTRCNIHWDQYQDQISIFQKPFQSPEDPPYNSVR